MKMAKFVDKLPIPSIVKPKSKVKGITYYEVEMNQFKQKLHRDLPETTVWGYRYMYPGPTFEVRKDEWVKVKWINALPDKHILPVDITIHGAGPDQPTVRTVVHLHGGITPAYSDGLPDAWFTNGFREVGPAFETPVYDYCNQQQAATLLYHDHTVGITRLNIYAGLIGVYIIRDAYEDFLNLSKGRFDIPMLIQDKSFNEDGSLYYPAYPTGNMHGMEQEEPMPTVYPSIVPEFFGNTILVNGKVWPYLEVEPRKYRFRLINGSNARFYRMGLSTGQPFYQIGTDDGLLEAPVITDEIVLGISERADVIIDFSAYWGKTIQLMNDAPSPFPYGEPVDMETTGQIMQFRVTLPLSSNDTSVIPHRMYPITRLPESLAVKTRNLTLDEATDQFGRLILLLDNQRWFDPITEKPRLGSVEIWSLINLTSDTHPMHLHLVHFQILDRQPFDKEYYEATGQILVTGYRTAPDLNEQGWKDTVRANPNEITRIIARFGPYTGTFPWHCHILEHEDHEMLRLYEVIY